MCVRVCVCVCVRVCVCVPSKPTGTTLYFPFNFFHHVTQKIRANNDGEREDVGGRGVADDAEDDVDDAADGDDADSDAKDDEEVFNTLRGICDFQQQLRKPENANAIFHVPSPLLEESIMGPNQLRKTLSV